MRWTLSKKQSLQAQLRYLDAISPTDAPRESISISHYENVTAPQKDTQAYDTRVLNQALAELRSAGPTSAICACFPYWSIIISSRLSRFYSLHSDIRCTVDANPVASIRPPRKVNCTHVLSFY